MMHFVRKFSLFILLIGYSSLTAQSNFFLNGTAMEMDSCYQLTPTENWQVGSIWNGEKIDLNESFEVVVDLFLGCLDETGADGIVFGLQPISTSIGVAGGDIGFGDVTPSLGVEFDTYQNIDYEDPVFDHITIIRDGNLRHNTPQGSLAGPVQANSTNPNIENCQYHPMRITWDADLQTLSVYLDCELRLSYSGDIINTIFNGDPEVFWGFTSATGGLNNIHEVCFSYTTFLNSLTDQTICPGDSVLLEASGGIAYEWSPSEGLSDSTIANPIATPEETTLYTVTILDDCGIPFFDEVLITVANDQFDVEISSTPSPLMEITAGTEFSVTATVTPDQGNYSYAWSSNIGSLISNPTASTTAITGSLLETGLETITLTVISEDGCIQQDSLLFEIESNTYDIPNAFTPNGDSTNDGFGVVTNANLSNYSCKVFNRWGQVVFESNDYSLFWDGNFKDDPAAADIYIYSIQFELDGATFDEKGDVTLIR